MMVERGPFIEDERRNWKEGFYNDWHKFWNPPWRGWL